MINGTGAGRQRRSNAEYRSHAHVNPSPLAIPVVDRLWIDAARELGFAVVRTPNAYASSDGAGGIAIGATEILDGDDALAQLVFHELCHAITEGDASRRSCPTGASTTRRGDVVREHACLRVQAHLADRFGLRAADGADDADTARTTTALPARSAGQRRRPGDEAARAPRALPIAGARRARFGAVGVAARTIERGAGAETAAAICARTAKPPAAPARLRARSRRRRPAAACAWLYVGGRGSRGRALPAERAGATATARARRASIAACERWEALVDCRTCGACCREAYHSVTVSVRDPVVWKQPDLIVRHGHRFEIRREGSRCAALTVTSDGRVPDPPDAITGAASRARSTTIARGLPRLRGRRPPLPGRPPPRRPERYAGLRARTASAARDDVRR